MKVFDYLKALTSTKQDMDMSDPLISEDYDQFMINRWISMCDAFIPDVNRINKYSDIPKSAHYKYYLSVLPQRNQFFQYIKKEDQNITILKKMICRYFECNLKESEDYLRKLSEEEMDEIVDSFRYGVNNMVKF